MATLSVTATPRTTAPPPAGASYRVASAVLMALFFAIGFLTCLNDVTIPHLKALFELDYTRAMLIQFSFFTAYFVVSMPAGALVRRVGYRWGIVIGLATAGVGCAGFLPAAGTRSYPVFLVALFIVASGFTILQVAANPYVAILGDRATAPSRLTLTQAFNSVGTAIAPLIGSALILAPAVAPDAPGLDAAAREAARSASAHTVVLPYAASAATLVLMALALARLHLPDATPESEGPAGRSAWTHRPLALGALAIFTYVGAEVAIGSFLVSFFAEPEIGGLAPASAARFVAFYWGGAMVGRFVGAGLLQKLPARRVLAAFAAGAATLVLATVLLHGQAAMAAILAVGLMNSIMFPTIFTLAIDGLGDATSQGSGILCMAIVGGAILPVVQGAVADRVGVHLAFLVPLGCYAYIAWYALRGSVTRVSARDEVTLPYALAASDAQGEGGDAR